MQTHTRAILSLIALILVLLPAAAIAAEKRRPNVVVLVADQWRAAATGYAGDPNVKTPHLDQLAASSCNFTHAVSGTPVCSPWRASFLTGQRPTTHGVFINDAHLADDALTLAEVLRDSGYTTAMIGKWHLNGRGRLSFIPPEDRQGFEYWKAMECTHRYNHSLYYADTPEKLQWPGYDAIAQADDARRYIAAHAAGEKPFLLCLWWGPPHNPYETAPAEFRKLYDPAALRLPANVPESMQTKIRLDLAGYYAHCSALDQCVGEIRQSLQDAGIEDNTLLLFTSDHGDMLGSNGQTRKQRPWDESIRIPMLWHYPAALGREGKKLDALMDTPDLMPTILSLCGVAIPKGVEGLDYSGYMTGGENPNRENAALIACVAPFAEWSRARGGREYRGLRTTRYTYVRSLDGPWLLYDNQSDPGQMHNLVNTPEARDVQAQLDALLTQRLVAAHDAFKPADVYLEKWGYKDRIDKNGALPTAP